MLGCQHCGEMFYLVTSVLVQQDKKNGHHQYHTNDNQRIEEGKSHTLSRWFCVLFAERSIDPERKFWIQILKICSIFGTSHKISQQVNFHAVFHVQVDFLVNWNLMRCPFHIIRFDWVANSLEWPISFFYKKPTKLPKSSTQMYMQK